MARLFVAVDLSIGVVEKLAITQNEITRRLGDAASCVRWVDPANIHLTLKFLGDVDEAVLPIVNETLGNLARPLFPFEVSCCGLGAFPDARRPRILWAGLDGKGAEVMGLLRQTIERDLAELGFPADEREFRPHVTLGRVRSSEALDLSELMEVLGDMDFGGSFVRDLVMFESELTPDGARYHVRRRYPLGER